MLKKSLGSWYVDNDSISEVGHLKGKESLDFDVLGFVL